MPSGRLCDLFKNPESLTEREHIAEDKQCHATGFHARTSTKARERGVDDAVRMECRHLLRTAKELSANQNQPLQFQLWLRAGTKPPIFANKDEKNFNSSVWRNFRKEFGFQVPKKRTTHQLMAAMYPLNIPPPSKIGVYTYRKFLAESSVIKDPTFKAALIEKAARMGRDLKAMELQSQLRNPPLDEKGAIIPPPTFKRFPADSFPPASLKEKLAFLESAPLADAAPVSTPGEDEDGDDADPFSLGAGGVVGAPGEGHGRGDFEGFLESDQNQEWRRAYERRRIDASPLRVTKERILQKKPGISINSTIGATYSFENQHNVNQGFHLRRSRRPSSASLPRMPPVSLPGKFKSVFNP